MINNDVIIINGFFRFQEAFRITAVSSRINIIHDSHYMHIHGYHNNIIYILSAT